jgi:ribosome modulation factor
MRTEKQEQLLDQYPDWQRKQAEQASCSTPPIPGASNTEDGKLERFTPGPWEAIAPDAESPCKAVVARDERFHESTRTICVITQPTPDAKNYIPYRRHDEPDPCETGDEDQANTDLIAAAPTMYAELKSMRDTLERACDGSCQIGIAGDNCGPCDWCHHRMRIDTIIANALYTALTSKDKENAT